MRRAGETHAFDDNAIHLLQSAVASDSFQMFKRYTETVRKQPPVALRDLLDFRREAARRSRSTKSRASPKSASG